MPFTARENLIKLTGVEIARIMFGDTVASKLAMVPLSNDPIKRRIQELLDHVLQLTTASGRRSGKFNLQLDETSDIGNYAQLMVFVRYLDTNDYVEQFLFCRLLTKNNAGKKILKWIRSLMNINLNCLTASLFSLMALRP